MKAVNMITQFFLRGFQKAQEEQRASGDNVVQNLNKQRLRAGDALDDDAKHAFSAGTRIVAQFMTIEAVASIVKAMDLAGAVLVRVGMPEQIPEDKQNTPDEVKAAAKEAAEALADMMSLVKAISQFALMSTDFEHIGEVVAAAEIVEIEKAEKEKEAAKAPEVPPAKSITGTASPLNRWTPSVN